MEGGGFRNHYEDFQALGVNIIGVSFDTPEDNQNWCTAQSFQFELWSDLERVLALYYGAATSSTQSMPSRKTVLLDDQGTLILEYPVVNVMSHPDQVLEDCQAIFQR